MTSLHEYNKTEVEIISIIKGMIKNIESGDVEELDGVTDAMDLIKQEVGFDDYHTEACIEYNLKYESDTPGECICVD